MAPAEGDDMSDTIRMHRRTFLAGSAGIVAASGFASPTPARAQGAKPLPGYVSWKDASAPSLSTPTRQSRRGVMRSEPA